MTNLRVKRLAHADHITSQKTKARKQTMAITTHAKYVDRSTTVEWRECPIKGHHIRTIMGTSKQILLLDQEQVTRLYPEKDREKKLIALGNHCILYGKHLGNGNKKLV